MSVYAFTGLSNTITLETKSSPNLRADLSLKIRDQTCRIRVATVGAIAQMLKKPLQQKQIAKGKRLILARWRHVASHALEGGKDFVRRAFQIQVEIGCECGPPPLGDG